MRPGHDALVPRAAGSQPAVALVLRLLVLCPLLLGGLGAAEDGPDAATPPGDEEVETGAGDDPQRDPFGLPGPTDPADQPWVLPEGAVQLEVPGGPDGLQWKPGIVDERDLAHRASRPDDRLDHSLSLRFGYPNPVALHYTAILDLDPTIHRKTDPITGPAATIELGPRAVKLGLGLHHGELGIGGGTWLRPMLGYLHVIQDGAGFERDMRFLGGELYLNAVIYGLNLGVYQRLDDDDDDDKERIFSAGIGIGL